MTIVDPAQTPDDHGGNGPRAAPPVHGEAGAWAVIPVKAFDSAKSRLVTLTADARRALAHALFERVVTAALAVRALAGVAVVTGSREVAARADALGAAGWLIDQPGIGAAVAAGLARLADRDAAVVVMSDLPEFATSDLAALLAGLRGRDVVIAPDRHDAGTNALALATPRCMPAAFGHPDSFSRHLCAARRRGLRVAVHRAPGLALDLDSPTDLAAWRASAAHDSSRIQPGGGSRPSRRRT